ncbi:MAG: hypothetical protein WBO08_06020 [Mycobacterium sp.]
MKWIPDTQTLEITERNQAALADKLDDPLSARSLRSPCGEVLAQAVEDDARNGSAGTEAVVQLTRSELAHLATLGATVTVGAVTVVSVLDSAHYTDRPAGVVFMPTSGETR